MTGSTTISPLWPASWTLLVLNVSHITLLFTTMITHERFFILRNMEQDHTNRQLGQPPFRSCIAYRFAGAIKYTGLRARSVCAVGDVLHSWSNDQGLRSLVNGRPDQRIPIGVNHTRVHVNVEGWTLGRLANFRSSTVGRLCIHPVRHLTKKTPKVREWNPLERLPGPQIFQTYISGASC